jgi:hypothetical protein
VSSTTLAPLKFYMPSIQAAASSFAVEASTAPVHARDEIDGVIAAQARNPGGGLLASSGVPAIYPRPVFAESGGLIAYGQSRRSPAAPLSAPPNPMCTDSDQPPAQ